jgi:hypothetical protein
MSNIYLKTALWKETCKIWPFCKSLCKHKLENKSLNGCYGQVQRYHPQTQIQMLLKLMDNWHCLVLNVSFSSSLRKRKLDMKENPYPHLPLKAIHTLSFLSSRIERTSNEALEIEILSSYGSLTSFLSNTIGIYSHGQLQ